MTLPKTVDQTSILTGERSKIKDLLRLRLTECGWSDQVRKLCRDVVKEEDANIDVDQIVQKVTPQARALVPDPVKRELLHKIKTMLMEQEGLDN